MAGNRGSDLSEDEKASEEKALDGLTANCRQNRLHNRTKKLKTGPATPEESANRQLPNSPKYHLCQGNVNRSTE